MWTEETISEAATKYVCALDYSEQAKYLIRNAFIKGCEYIINNTQKIN